MSLDLYQRCMEKLGQGVRKKPVFLGCCWRNNRLYLDLKVCNGFSGNCWDPQRTQGRTWDLFVQIRNTVDTHRTQRGCGIFGAETRDGWGSSPLQSISWSPWPLIRGRVNDLALFFNRSTRFSGRLSPASTGPGMSSHGRGCGWRRDRGFTEEYSGGNYELWSKNGVGKPEGVHVLAEGRSVCAG